MSMFNKFIKNKKKDEERDDKRETDNFIEMYKRLCERHGRHIGAEINYSPQGITASPVVMKTKKEKKDLPEAPKGMT